VNPLVIILLVQRKIKTNIFNLFIFFLINTFLFLLLCFTFQKTHTKSIFFKSNKTFSIRTPSKTLNTKTIYFFLIIYLFIYFLFWIIVILFIYFLFLKKKSTCWDHCTLASFWRPSKYWWWRWTKHQHLIFIWHLREFLITLK